MSREQIPLDVPKRHVDSSFMSDWMVVRANGEVVVVHEAGEGSITTYTIGQPTKNPRVMASASAVIWEGQVLTPLYEDRQLILQHTFSGIQERLPIDTLLDESVPTLERTELVRLKGVGGRVEFDCIDCGDHVERERHQMDIPGMTPQRCTSCTFDRMGEKG